MSCQSYSISLYSHGSETVLLQADQCNAAGAHGTLQPQQHLLHNQQSLLDTLVSVCASIVASIGRRLYVTDLYLNASIPASKI